MYLCVSLLLCNVVDFYLGWPVSHRIRVAFTAYTLKLLTYNNCSDYCLWPRSSKRQARFKYGVLAMINVISEPRMVDFYWRLVTVESPLLFWYVFIPLVVSRCIYILVASTCRCIYTLAASICIYILVVFWSLYTLVVSRWFYTLVASRWFDTLVASRCIYTLVVSICIYTLVVSICIYTLVVSRCFYILVVRKCI